MKDKGNSNSHGARPVHYNHHNDEVDSDRQVVNTELSLSESNQQVVNTELSLSERSFNSKR